MWKIVSSFFLLGAILSSPYWPPYLPCILLQTLKNRRELNRLPLPLICPLFPAPRDSHSFFSPSLLSPCVSLLLCFPLVILSVTKTKGSRCYRGTLRLLKTKALELQPKEPWSLKKKKKKNETAEGENDIGQEEEKEGWIKRWKSLQTPKHKLSFIPKHYPLFREGFPQRISKPGSRDVLLISH